MSNKLFQNMLTQYKRIINRELGIVDENGNIVYCTEPEKIGEYKFEALNGITVKTDKYVKNGCTYKPLEQNGKFENLLYVVGEDEEAYKAASMIAVSISSVQNFYDEKYNKLSYIKNIILDNILPGDIYIKCKELNIKENVARVIYLIKFAGHFEYSAFDIIQNMFPDKTKDFVISIDENSIVLLREMKPGNGSETTCEAVEIVASQIIDTVSAEFYVKLMIGIGSIVSDIKDLSRSFKEAQVALEVGKVFDNEKEVINYKNLGIGRIIYQLPNTLCEVFLQEVFKSGSLESLDRESLITIHSFFENNLNVSETSRKLFVHRNTLVYRLEKIKKLTGLDLREFEHAIIFKVALMVKKYLSSKPIKY